MSKTTDSLSSTCVLCCQGIKIYAVGPCDHHICFKCSTKMRAICNQMYCAVCRTEMLKVIFMNKLHPFDGIISHKFPNDRKFGISFATSRIQEEYRKLLAHQCRVCGIKRQPDATFRQLQDHLRRDHKLFFCQLCVDHVKILTSERKLYTRKELAQHRRHGDADDLSYRGHPNCGFCNERYFDKDELMRHLRREHYFCHFCESDGITNQYYGDYVDLADHFREEHFLCEEDDCRNTEFTNAFRTDIDLKAHRAKVHSGKMTKSQARQMRQVDVEFSLPARPTSNNRGRRDGARGGGARGGRDRYRRDRNERDTERAIEASLESAAREEVERDTKKSKPKMKKPRDRRRDDERSESPVQNIDCNSRGDSGDDKENKTGTRESLRESLTRKNSFPDVEPIAAASKPPDKGDFPTLGDVSDPPFEMTGKWSVAPAQDENDFPTLGNVSDTPFQMGGKWSLALPQKENDFPVLGNGDSSIDMPLNVAASFNFYSSKTTIKGPLNMPVEQSQQQPQSKNDNDDFPTLSSIASILGVNQKGVLKPRKKIKNVSKNKPQNESSAAIETSVSENSASSFRNTPFSSVLNEKKDSAKAKKKEESLSKENDLDKERTLSEEKVLSSDKVTSRNEKIASKPEKITSKPEKITSKTEKITSKPEMISSKPETITSKPEKAQIPPQMQSNNNMSSTLKTSALSTKFNSRPPPGFAVLPQSSSIPSFPQPPPGFNQFASISSEPEFVPPPNFKQRNLDLVKKIQDFCAEKEDLFSQFKQDSGEFRQGIISANEYYRRCIETLSEENFHRVFNELVSLLPDLTKQQQLLEAHDDYKAKSKLAPKDTVLKISNKKSGKSAWNASAVLVNDVASDRRTHEDFPALSASKGTQEDFPALSGGKGKPRPMGVVPTWGAGSWGRRK